MKIGKKLLISFTIISIFLLLSALITTVYTLKINNKLKEITEDINPSENDIQDMISILWKANYIVQRYLTETNGEELSNLRFEFEHINKIYSEKTDKLLEKISKDSLNNKLSMASNNKETFEKLAIKLMHQREQEFLTEDVRDEATILVQYSIAKQLERDVVDAVDILQEILDDLEISTSMKNKESADAVKNSIIMIFLTVLLTLIAVGVIWSGLTKSITNPLKTLSRATSKIGKGDFNFELKIKESDDEVSELANTFKQMVRGLKKIIEENPRLKKYIQLKSKKESLAKKYVIDSGVSYLIKDNDSSEAYEIIVEKMGEGKAPLLITREKPKIAEEKYGVSKNNLLWLSEEKQKGINSSSNLNYIQKEIISFIDKNERSIILFDRSDYILNKYKFENFLRFITNINDKVMSKKSTFLLPIDPTIFNNKQLSLLEKELHQPPKQSIKMTISDELMDILKFISNRATINQPPTYKDVGNNFSITSPTTKKKVEELYELGLISISKRGRNKVLKPTRDGERIITNR